MDTPNVPAIAIRGLTKRFGRLTAVRALDLDVEQGEVFGFLGLNGAGKTTTIRLLLDLIRPSAGRAAILGHDCRTDGLAARAQVGFLPGEAGFYRDMTGRQVLDLTSRLSRVRLRGAWQHELLERLDFREEDLDRRLREYSTGMKRKLAIVQAFQADPAVLILDEPTEGLDPVMQEAFYALLLEVQSRGRTVFLSSHILSEVERVCGRVAVLRTGELVLAAAVEDVRRLAPRTVRVLFSRPVGPPAGSWLAGVQVVALAPDRWDLRTQGPMGSLVSALAGLPVADLQVREPRLEDVLIGYYRGPA